MPNAPYTLPDGTRAPEAPPCWPFGLVPTHFPPNPHAGHVPRPTLADLAPDDAPF